MNVPVKMVMCWVCLCLAALAVSPVEGSGDESGRLDLAALESLTGKWIALRSQLAEESQSWQRQQEHWQREIALLQQETADRRARLDADTAFLSGVEEAQADIVLQMEDTEAALRELGVVVGRHEVLLRDWALRVPQGLQPELGSGFHALPANDAAALRVGVLRRLQTVLALYTQIESLQNNLHLVRELVAFGGMQREAEILYVGLARGFAVSAADDWAAIGTPTAQGWVWQEQSAEAARIRLAIRVLQRDATVQLVPLLLQLAAEEQP